MGNGIRPKATELASEAFAEVERLRHQIERLAKTNEELTHAGNQGTAALRSVQGTADGTNPVTLSLTPRAGVLWELWQIAVSADNITRNVAFYFGDGLGTPFAAGNTNAIAGGIVANTTLAGMPLPGGLSVRVVILPAPPAGTVCYLSMLVRELVIPSEG
jgi:hypothetical protein